MKTVILLSLALFTSGTLGFLIKVPGVLTPTKIGSGGWTNLQKVILQLFDNICEDSTDPMIIKNADEFTIDSSGGDYSKPEVIDNLRIFKTDEGLLPKGEIFTEHNKDYLNELRVIYEVLYYAKDFKTFLKAAAWARQNVNCGLFFDALYLATLSRRDTEVLSVPAPYEILPNYFITKDIIIKASTILSGKQITPSDTVRVVGNAYVLEANYTADIYDNNYESKLAYFHEDVGLNSYYFFQKIKRAPWFNVSSDMSDRYGEYLYHMMKQLATRYDLERYSNGLPILEGIDWSSFSANPYDPLLIYSNGNEFGQRRTFVDTFDTTSLQVLQEIENNIASVVGHLISLGYNKTQILNHAMEILVTGDKSYETIARRLVGIDSSLDSSLPSVMDHYITSLRDPVFWKLNKQIVHIVDRALANLLTYSRNELYFPGIEVLNVEVKKMSTTFETFEIDVTDALKTATIDTTFQIKIEQPRLSHKPFTMKLNISSLVTDKGLIKIYLGPKIAPGELSSKINQFMLLDSFEASFKIGANVISRSSKEMQGISGDLPSFRALRNKVNDAEFGIDTTSFLSGESKTDFPARLILPKGSPEGVPLQIFVFVAPFVKASTGGLHLLPNLEFNSAVLSPGFPLDSNIDDSILFSLPNAMLRDVVITHKSIKKIGSDGSAGGEKWKGGSGRPEFTKKDYDFTSRKVQYAKESDYEPKSTDYNKDVEDEEKNKTTNVNSNTEDFTTGNRGGRPEFTKKDFNYTPQKLQYAKKSSYEPKSIDYNKDVEDEEKKKDADVNSNTGDSTADNGSGGRSEFTKEDLEYPSLKLQYAKKTDYEPKSNKYTKDEEKKKNTDVNSNIEEFTAGNSSSGKHEFSKKEFDHTFRNVQYVTKPKRTNYNKDVIEKEKNKNTDVNSNTEDFTAGKIDLPKDKDQYIYVTDNLPEVSGVTEKLIQPYFDVPRYNRTPSVYDYLFNWNDDTVTEFKVYE